MVRCVWFFRNFVIEPIKFLLPMKKFWLFIWFGWLGASFTYAQVTISPVVESQSSAEAKITRVELKGSYTIISFRYRLSKNRTYDEQRRPQEKPSETQPRNLQELFERMLGGQGGGQGGSYKSWISIDPRSKLIAKNGRKNFRFVKAEGIPESPEQYFIEPGEEVNFKVYYERLDRGIEMFDYFEGKNDGRTVFWNFKGVKIKNPAPIENNDTPPPVVKKEPDKPKEQETPPVVAEKEPEKPTKVEPSEVRITGTVYDAKTKKPIDAKLVFQLQNEKIDSTQAFTGTGTYKSSLPVGNNYKCVATAKGYLETQETIDLRTATASITKDIYLTPISAGEKVALKNIYFETSKAVLLVESFTELNKLVKMMKENPSMEIRLEGHTDGLGDFDMNLQLSRDRVDSVKEYLVKNGIASTRIETQGYGSTRPVTNGKSEEERRKNRRVEFVITKP